MLKFSGAARAHVAGVRVDRGRVRVHEVLEHVVAAQLVHARAERRVALVERLADLVLRRPASFRRSASFLTYLRQISLSAAVSVAQLAFSRS
jgi:hypothetical protein